MTPDVAWPVAVFDDAGYGYPCADGGELESLAAADVSELVAAFDSLGRRLALAVEEEARVVVTVSGTDPTGLVESVTRFAADRSCPPDRLPRADAPAREWVAALHEIERAASRRRLWSRRRRRAG